MVEGKYVVMKVSKTRDFYTNMIKEVGLDSPFEPGCVKNIVEKLEKYVK